MNNDNDIEALEIQQAELQQQLAELREKLIAQKKLAAGKKVRQIRPGESVRPLRDLVLEILAEAGCPLNSLLLASIIRSVHGRDVPSTRFGTLSNDEEKSYDSRRPRPVYLCHCLTYDQGQAVKRFWARSDWPLADRIMGPMTGRILFLRGAAWTIELAHAVKNHKRSANHSEILNFVAADQARDAGLAVKRGEFPYEEWLAEISIILEKYAKEDRIIREESALQFSGNLSDRALLFGSRQGLVSLPGSSASWRSEVE